jgi:predicted GTPase
VLVRGAQSPDAVALACEGLAATTMVPSGIPVYPADTIPDDLEVDSVELLPCEPATADGVGAWARARGVPLTRVEQALSPAPEGVRVVAVSACSTGSGKTPLVRRVARALQRSGRRVAVVRHPIAGLLLWDRFAPAVKRAPHELVGPVEEREELAPLVGAGIPVVTGLDPDGSLRAAAHQADVIVWDGGGAASPWVTPYLHLVAVDLLRDLPDGIEERLANADAVVLTKADSAAPDRIREIEDHLRQINDRLVLADLTVGVQDGPALRDRRAVLVDDWPSLALGGLAAGAAAVAARRFRCGAVDPRPFAVGAIRDVLESHSHIGAVIPSLGRTPLEIADFAASVYATPGDVVLWASNADPAGIITDERRPVIRAYGELTEVAGSSIQEILEL